jgi:hypothetical protein
MRHLWLISESERLHYYLCRDVLSGELVHLFEVNGMLVDSRDLDEDRIVLNHPHPATGVN